MWSNGLTESTSGFDVALCLGSATTHMLELKIPPVLTGAVTAMGMWPRLPPLAHILICTSASCGRGNGTHRCDNHGIGDAVVLESAHHCESHEASPPFLVICATVSSQKAIYLAVTITFAPSDPNRGPMAFTIPLLLPVTIATLFCKRLIGSLPQQMLPLPRLSSSSRTGARAGPTTSVEEAPPLCAHSGNTGVSLDVGLFQSSGEPMSS